MQRMATDSGIWGVLSVQGHFNPLASTRPDRIASSASACLFRVNFEYDFEDDNRLNKSRSPVFDSDDFCQCPHPPRTSSLFEDVLQSGSIVHGEGQHSGP